MKALLNRRAAMPAVCLLLSVVTFSSSARSQCEALVQLTNYFPAVCNSEFESASCQDICAGSDPEFSRSCFKTLNLPCNVTNDLFLNAKGLQHRDDYKWVHVTDLLSYPALLSELHVFQTQLYRELYDGFIKLPNDVGFSPASDQLRRENFRLSLLEQLKAKTEPLRSAGLYRRYDLGVVLEQELTAELTEIFAKLDRFPYFSTLQKTDIKAELSALASQQTRYWQLLKKYSPTKIKQSRIAHLNNRLNNFVDGLNRLSAEQQNVIFKKVDALTTYFDMKLTTCTSGYCAEPISELQFDLAQDEGLVNFELLLGGLNNEVEALTNAYDEHYQYQPPALIKRPDFGGFISGYFHEFYKNPEHVALTRLATAIDVAYLLKGNTGRAVFESLQQRSDGSAIPGFSTLASKANTPILLCSEFDRIAPHMKAIQEESFDVANQAKALVTQLLVTWDSTLIPQIQALIARLNTLALQSRQIASVDQFSEDRLVNINWSLQSSNFGHLDQERQLIELEYFEYDGMFWTPNMSANLNQLFPDIIHFSTQRGSLFPYGTGETASLNQLQMTLRQSPFTACANQNSTINAVLKLTDSDGVITRKVLTAELDQM